MCQNHRDQRAADPADHPRHPGGRWRTCPIRRGQQRRRGPAEGSESDRTRPDVQRLEAFGLTWLNIEEPTELETAWLAEHHEFHPLDLEDVLSRRRQRAKIDEYPDYLFIVLHFPRFDKRAGRLQAAELNIFVGRGPRHHAAQRAAEAAERALVALRAQRDRPRAVHEQGLGLPALRARQHHVQLLRSSTRSASSSTRSRTRCSRARATTSSATSRTSSRRSSTTAAS